MVARSFYLKCFLLAELQGGRDGLEFTSVNILFCDVQNRKLDRLYTVLMDLCSQILHVPAECLVSLSKNMSSPKFPFSSLKRKKRRREKVEEDWSTMGVGWDADKVDYEVFPSYLLSTRLSLVIKGVLLFYSSEVGLVWAEHYELIVFDNGDEGPNAA